MTKQQNQKQPKKTEVKKAPYSPTVAVVKEQSKMAYMLLYAFEKKQYDKDEMTYKVTVKKGVAKYGITKKCVDEIRNIFYAMKDSPYRINVVEFWETANVERNGQLGCTAKVKAVNEASGQIGWAWKFQPYTQHSKVSGKMIPVNEPEAMVLSKAKRNATLDLLPDVVLEMCVAQMTGSDPSAVDIKHEKDAVAVYDPFVEQKKLQTEWEKSIDGCEDTREVYDRMQLVNDTENNGMPDEMVKYLRNFGMLKYSNLAEQEKRKGEIPYHPDHTAYGGKGTKEELAAKEAEAKKDETSVETEKKKEV